MLDRQQLMGRTCMRAIGRLAESEGPVLFARFDEAEKCKFIEANVPVEAWSSTDDGEGLLVKASALREQVREMLVSTTRPRTSNRPGYRIVVRIRVGATISAPCNFTVLRQQACKAGAAATQPLSQPQPQP